MSEWLLGIDLGGGGIRVVLAEASGRRSVCVDEPLAHRPAPGSGGAGFDVDVEGLWRALGRMVPAALSAAGVAPAKVRGVAVGALRLGSVVIDADGEVLLAASNRDARGAAQGLRLAAEHGAALSRATGMWPLPNSPVARLLWLAESEPRRLERAQAMLSLDAWLGHRLTGERASDPTQASASGLFDLQRRDWAFEWIERLGLPAALFPRIVEPGALLGRLEPEAADSLGLPAGTPVALAGGDTQAALIAVGALEPGQLALVAGTSAPFQAVVGEPVIDASGRLWSGAHPCPGQGVLESNAGPVGESLEWFGRLLAPDALSPVATLFDLASRAEPGAGGFVSTLGAQVMDLRHLSVPIGAIHLGHLGLPDAALAREALCRSVVDGIVFALRENLDQLRSQRPSQSDFPSVRLTGGLSRSAFFARRLADGLGLPVEVSPHPQGTGIGAAVCAGVAAGLFEDLAAGASRLSGPPARIEPDPARASREGQRHQEWRRLREAQAPAEGIARELALPHVLQYHDVPTGAAREPAPRPRVLVTAEIDEASRQALAERADVEVRSFREHLNLLTGPALVEALAGIDVFVTEVDVVDAASLAQLPDLRVIFACRGDAVNVDVDAATALGIPVLHAPGRNAEGVADLALGFALMAARKLPLATGFLRQPGLVAGDMGRMGQAFRTFQGTELWRRRVGLVGFGAVGRAFTRRLRACGADVVAFDPYVEDERLLAAGARPLPFEELLETSDIVSLHAAVSDETRGLIGAAELARMRPDAFLINTARAALIDEEALVDALSRDRIAGAALDVFSVEPPGADHPLLAFDSVIATPHVGGNTRQVAAHQGALVVAELSRLLDGEPPRHALNPQAAARFDWRTPRPQLSSGELARIAAAPGPAVTDLQAAGRPPRTSAPTPRASAAAAAPAKLVDGMRAVLVAFTEGLEADSALGRFARDRDVALHFRLVDLPLDFSIELRGDVRSALGVPAGARDAEVELAMRAEILDGMFTGRVNPMQSAMDGKLSFSGDTAKAMTLQQIQDDLSRVYRAARERAGDPGDLTATPDPTPSGSAAAAGSAGGSDAVREELVGIVGELYATELITATGGNVSARSTEAPDELWITPSQLFKGDLRPDTLVRIGLDGRSLDEFARSASSERMMHCAIYAARPEARAVVHAHAPHATILANTELPFVPVSTEAAFFGDIPRVPFIMPGTDELAKAVAEAMGSGWAVLMKNHGLIVAGRSLRRAADMVEIIDRSAQIILGCHAVGREPPSLPAETVGLLRSMGDLVA